MKFIVGNNYVQSYQFSNSLEMDYFIQKQDVPKMIFEESCGEHYYCYIFHNALTQKKLFLIAFSSDEKEGDIGLLFWIEYATWVIYTGGYIYMLNRDMQIQISFEMFAPLIGMYLLPHDNGLLLLEEAYLRVVDHTGKILKENKLGFVEQIDIQENSLLINTEEGNCRLDFINL